MKKSTRDYLIKVYNRLPYKNRDTCLKFYYDFNKVGVSLYFDAYDKDSVTFSMILLYDKKYYYTLLNILDTQRSTEFLKDIDYDILNQIKTQNGLKDFFEYMEEMLLNSKCEVLHYYGDKCYRDNLKNKNNSEDLPFWWYPKKVRMSDETLEKLTKRVDISESILREIQRRGFTIVRTKEPRYRTQLTFILKQIGIILK